MGEAKIFWLSTHRCDWGTLRSIVVVAQNEAEAVGIAEKEADDCANPRYDTSVWKSCDCVAIGTPFDTASRIICVDYIEE